MPAVNFDLTARQRGQRGRIQDAFDLLNSLVQRSWCIVIQHRDSLLGDDRSCIDTLINEMHRATGDFYAILKRLFPGLEPRERRQQTWVNIDDTPFEDA